MEERVGAPGLPPHRHCRRLGRGDATEGAAQHEVSGREGVGVTEDPHGQALGGPGTDAGDAQEFSPGDHRVLFRIEPQAAFEGAGDRGDRAGPGPGQADLGLDAFN